MKRIFKIGCFQLLIAWYDFWIGFYYDVRHRTLYFIPIPCLVFRFEIKGRKNNKTHRCDRILRIDVPERTCHSKNAKHPTYNDCRNPENFDTIEGFESSVCVGCKYYYK